MRTWPLSFKRDFVDLIQAGEKRQTVRAERRDGKRPRPGDLVTLYFGLRTRGCQCIGSGIVTACFSVHMDFEEGTLALDEGRLTFLKADAFARQDGFRNWSEMERWFHEQHGPRDFDGFGVQWKLT